MRILYIQFCEGASTFLAARRIYVSGGGGMGGEGVIIEMYIIYP